MPLKIAFGYKMGSGKDSACDFITTKFDKVKTFKFADPIYELLSVSLNTIREDYIKDRKFLQFIGDWGKSYNHNVWVDILIDKVNQYDNYDCLLISDLRHINEFNMLKDNGWILIKLVRDNISNDIVCSGNITHSSENELDSLDDGLWHYVIENNSSLESLFGELDKILKMLK